MKLICKIRVPFEKTLVSFRGYIKTPVLVAVAVLGVLISLFVLFNVLGPPLGHSAAYNVSWMQQFSHQFWGGSLYPRWLFDSFYGAGSPIFYFYAPMPFWVTALITGILCTACSGLTSMLVGFLFLLGLSGVAFYAFSRLVVRPSIAAVSAALYVFMPYHFAIDFWQRSVIGEVTAYIWMPLVLMGLVRGNRLNMVISILAYAGLVLSHLPSALLFSPMILAFAVFQFRKQAITDSLLIGILGVGIASIYVIPAMFSQDLINASAWQHGSEQFNPLNWLWLSPDAQLPAFSRKVLLALAAASGVAATSIILTWPVGAKATPCLLFVLAGLVYAWFMMTFPSTFLWQNIGLLRNVQFPWRIGIVVDLVAVMGFMVALEQLLGSQWRKWLLIGLAALFFSGYYLSSAGTLFWAMAGGSSDLKLNQLLERVDLGYDNNAQLTKWYARIASDRDFESVIERLANVPEIEVISGFAAVSLNRESANAIRMQIEARSAVRVIIRHFYYPGWKLLDESNKSLIEIFPSSRLGLIEFSVDPGTHDLTLSRGVIWSERIGQIISIIAFVAFLIIIKLRVSSNNSTLGPSQSCGVLSAKEA